MLVGYLTFENHAAGNYTEQKWKRYTAIIYILWESIGQKVFTKA